MRQTYRGMAQERRRWLPLLERVRRLKADRDAEWAVFDADTQYAHQLQLAREAQGAAQKRTETTQAGALARQTQAQGAEAAERGEFALRYGEEFAALGYPAPQTRSEAQMLVNLHQQRQITVGKETAGRAEEDLRLGLYTVYGDKLAMSEQDFMSLPLPVAQLVLERAFAKEAAGEKAQMSAEAKREGFREKAIRSAMEDIGEFDVGDEEGALQTKRENYVRDIMALYGMMDATPEGEGEDDEDESAIGKDDKYTSLFD